MRRMSGRNPNFILIGLIFVIILLTYKCWLLSSQSDDLAKEIHKLQAELKMSGQKQEQYERTNQILQGNVHDLDEKQKKLKTQVDEEDQQLEEAVSNIKIKDYEITKLKNQLLKKEESEKDLMQQLEEKENKIEELVSDTQHILTLKNDAEEALSEKDSQINNLKREVEQAKSVATEYEARLTNVKEEFSKLKQEFDQKRKEDIGAQSAKLPGPLNLPEGEGKGPNRARGDLGRVPSRAVHTRDIGLGGLKFYPGVPILPREPSNAVRAKPRFSVAELVKEKQEPLPNQIQEPDSNANLADQVKSGALIGENGAGYAVNNVIPNPPLGEHNPPPPQPDNQLNGVIEKPNNKPSVGEDVPQDVGNPVLQEPHFQRENNIMLKGPFLQEAHNLILQKAQRKADKEPESMVLMPPHNLEDNLDAAVDEEGKAVDDPADDQDEEGKEIKRDLENYYDKGEGNPHADEANDGGGDDENGGRHEPLGIGAKQEIPRQEGEKDPDGRRGMVEDDVNLEDDVDHRGNERVYEANLDHKIRNLGRT